MGGDGFPHTTKQFSRYQLGVLRCNLTLPRDSVTFHSSRGSVLQDYPTPTHSAAMSDTSCWSKLSPVLLTHWLPFEVTMTPFSGSVNLLERFTELTDTFYIRDRPSVLKGHDPGTARWKRHIEQSMRWGRRAPLSPNLHVFTKWKHSEPRSFEFIWRLHYTGAIDSLIT